MGFEELQLNPDIIKAITRKGYTEPTEIQKKCIPLIRTGVDIVGQSLTGSGKTAAFSLPIIEMIHPGKGIQALILAPTRELAIQVDSNIKNYSSFTKIRTIAVYGGAGMFPQITGLKHADIVVATPGRFLDMVDRGHADLRNTKMFVLDEADKMFEMGFIEDIQKIMSFLPEKRQTILFSATMPHELMSLIKRHLKNPVMIKEQSHVDKKLLKQIYYDVEQRDKFSLLVHLLKTKTSGLALVFCSTRNSSDFVSRNLKKYGIKAMVVHGGMTQNKRIEAVDALKREYIDVLVATDVAARGLDINNISHVYNFDSPKNASEYTHRIGRTARAGKSGDAVTLLSDRDHQNFRNVTSDRELKIQREDTPAFERLVVERMQSSRDDSRGGFRGRSGGPSRDGPRRGPSRDGDRGQNRFPRRDSNERKDYRPRRF